MRVVVAVVKAPEVGVRSPGLLCPPSVLGAGSEGRRALGKVGGVFAFTKDLARCEGDLSATAATAPGLGAPVAEGIVQHHPRSRESDIGRARRGPWRVKQQLVLLGLVFYHSYPVPGQRRLELEVLRYAGQPRKRQQAHNQ